MCCAWHGSHLDVLVADISVIGTRECEPRVLIVATSQRRKAVGRQGLISGPAFMSLLERTFGNEITTRTLDTVRRCARA
jgi:hypothetical protein